MEGKEDSNMLAALFFLVSALVTFYFALSEMGQGFNAMIGPSGIVTGPEAGKVALHLIHAIILLYS